MTTGIQAPPIGSATRRADQSTGGAALSQWTAFTAMRHHGITPAAHATDRHRAAHRSRAVAGSPVDLRASESPPR